MDDAIIFARDDDPERGATDSRRRLLVQYQTRFMTDNGKTFLHNGPITADATREDLRAVLEQYPDLARALGHSRIPNARAIAQAIHGEFGFAASAGMTLGQAEQRTVQGVLRVLGVVDQAEADPPLAKAPPASAVAAALRVCEAIGRALEEGREIRIAPTTIWQDPALHNLAEDATTALKGLRDATRP